MIKAIAIDDEPLALQVLDVYCNTLPNLSLEKTFSNLSNAKKYLNKFPVDVIFLDIEMPTTNGINFYKSLNHDVKVVFTTAHDRYAVEGFNVNAVDYLLKPFSLERFLESVNRIEKLMQIDVNNFQENTHLFIRADYKLHRIPLENIVYIEAMDDYVKIYIEGEKTLVARATMKGILQKLPDNLFIRIHKSYIVPITAIKQITTNEVYLKNIQLPIGNSYKKDLESFLNQ